MRVSATKLYVFLFLIVVYGNFTLLLSLLNIFSGKICSKVVSTFLLPTFQSLTVQRENTHHCTALVIRVHRWLKTPLNNCIQYFKKPMGFSVLLSVICIN